MASTERELELEGHTLPTADILAEASRLLDLARTHAAALRAEGVEQRVISETDQLREMINKEHQRVEAKPPKEFKPSKEMERLLGRAFQWRANLLRRVDRAYLDDRLGRLKYRRAFQHHRLPERVYEELFLLVNLARLDLKKLTLVKADEALINAGEDLCYELQALPVPNRAAQAEYELALENHRYGPPPAAPEPPPKLPATVDSAKTLSTMKGRLYFMLRSLSAQGQLAFNAPKEKEEAKAEAVRRDFVLRLKPTEDDDDLVAFGRLFEDRGPAQKSATPAVKKAEAPAPAPTAAQPAAPPAPPRLSVTPGGPTPPPPSDPLMKPPARAIGLVRPSPTRGSS